MLNSVVYKKTATAIVMTGIAFFLMTFSGIHVQAKTVNTTDATVSAEQTQEVGALNAINAVRVQNGLQPLTLSTALVADAKIRAAECAVQFSHTRPDGSSWYTLDSANMYGENLAANYANAEDVVSAWMASPTHRANLLCADFTTCEMEEYKVGGRTFWAAEFGI
jgi:uncharacterized protein YkwD